MSEIQSDNKAPTNRRPIKVCILGSVAAGKTCFLAGLGILAEANRNVAIQVHAKGNAKRRLEELADCLRRQEWPASTNSVDVFELGVMFHDQWIDIVVVDYPGEDFSQQIRLLNSEQIEVLYDHYQNADTMLLMLDPDFDVRGYDHLGAEQREQRLRRQDAHLQAIREAWLAQSKPKTREAANALPKHRSDVGIVLTKCDQYPELATEAGALEFVKQHAAPMLDKIRRQSGQLQVFPLSAVGATAYSGAGEKQRQVPAAALAPSGYESILAWIVKRHRWRAAANRRRLRNIGVMACISMAALAGLVELSQQASFWRVVDSPTMALEEKIVATAGQATWMQHAVGAKRTEMYDTLIADLNNEVESARTAQAIDRVRQVVDRMLELRPLRRASDLKKLHERCDSKLEDSQFEEVRVAYEQSQALFPELAGRYLQKFSVGRYAPTVKDWLEAWKDRDRKARRSLIKTIAIENSSTLERKAAEIDAYLQKWGDKEPQNAAAIRRAAELARRFAQRNSYTVKLKRSGEFTSKRTHKIELKVGDTTLPIQVSSQNATIINWDSATFQFQWMVGEPLHVAMRSPTWTGRIPLVGATDLVADKLDKGLTALLLVSGRVDLSVESTWATSVVGAFVEFEIEGITPTDLQAVSDYLIPGERW